jgi:hypothetical protein
MSVQAWTSREFHDGALDWVERQVRSFGLELAGWTQPHVRHWSSTIRVMTSAEPLWFKVNGVGTRHEPAVVQQLSARVPELVPEVLAADLGRGWSLSRDAGPVLREVLSPDRSGDAWEAVLVGYAEAQLRLTGAADALLAAGLREVSPATVPVLARELVEDLAAVPLDEGGLSAEDVTGVQRVLPRLDDWCAELAGSGVPDSIQHDDLHSGNVCWDVASGTGRVIDWGDASWGFPLGTMLVTLNTLHGTQARRLRDAYLEAFTGFADRARLVHCVDRARRTGCVAKALAWRAALLDVPLRDQAELGFPVRAWLLELRNY